MLMWLLITIVSYLFFSLAYFGDKLVLAGGKSKAAAKKSLNPKLYTFYVSLLSVLVIFLVPFTAFTVPDITALAYCALEAVVYILGLYAMFLALEKFEVSRVMPTIGAIQPLLILLLTWRLWGAQMLSMTNLLAFALLILGSVIISLEKKLEITPGYVALVLFSSSMFSLDYVLSKLVFLHQPFLQGLIWMRMFSFLFALLFLFDKTLRAQIFTKHKVLDKKAGALFLGTQTIGGLANILQSLAIALVPVTYLAIVNSLRGIQYVFLFLITICSSLFFPRILKEGISKKIVLQKTVAIVLIMVGLGILISH